MVPDGAGVGDNEVAVVVTDGIGPPRVANSGVMGSVGGTGVAPPVGDAPTVAVATSGVAMGEPTGVGWSRTVGSGANVAVGARVGRGVDDGPGGIGVPVSVTKLRESVSKRKIVPLVAINVSRSPTASVIATGPTADGVR